MFEKHWLSYELLKTTVNSICLVICTVKTAIDPYEEVVIVAFFTRPRCTTQTISYFWNDASIMFIMRLFKRVLSNLYISCSANADR